VVVLKILKMTFFKKNIKKVKEIPYFS